jgi:hypothetical protein
MLLGCADLRSQSLDRLSNFPSIASDRACIKRIGSGTVPRRHCRTNEFALPPGAARPCSPLSTDDLYCSPAATVDIVQLLLVTPTLPPLRKLCEDNTWAFTFRGNKLRDEPENTMLSGMDSSKLVMLL